MGKRKVNNKKPALTSAQRVRMHRQRKQLSLNQNKRVSEYLGQFEQNHPSVEEISSNETQNTVETSQIKNQLQRWAVDFRISKRALNALLPILITGGMSSLPRNYRTLQSTPVDIEIVQAAGGQLWHNGLKKSIKNIFSTLSRDVTIYLKFNIDGLPLYKSSKISFWPILASIDGM